MSEPIKVFDADGEAVLRHPPDPYGLENPGEFFAVASGLFFEEPRVLKAFSPELYRQLALFYRQNPVGTCNRPPPR